jgi:hypothetical protein
MNGDGGRERKEERGREREEGRERKREKGRERGRETRRDRVPSALLRSNVSVWLATASVLISVLSLSHVSLMDRLRNDRVSIKEDSVKIGVRMGVKSESLHSVRVRTSLELGFTCRLL